MGGWIKWTPGRYPVGTKAADHSLEVRLRKGHQVQGALLARDNWVGGLGMGVRK